MVILSLCDGISCGRVALERAGIKIDKYYASEIDSHAIAITRKNYPDTVQLGDIRNVKGEVLKGLPKIDVVIAGTPCQNLSITVINDQNHNQGLEGEKSSLFYQFYYILKWLQKFNNPNLNFLLENVESMRDEDKETITAYLGVDPVMIDSALVSAQDRKRYYWTNIQDIELPTDKGISLKDIMEQSPDEKYFYGQDFTFHGWDKKVIATLNINGHDILKRVYNPNYKSATLTACRGGNTQKKVFDNGRCRKLTPLEYERLQTLPDGYTAGFSDSARYNTCGDGWTVDVITHIFTYLAAEQRKALAV